MLASIQTFVSYLPPPPQGYFVCPTSGCSLGPCQILSKSIQGKFLTCWKKETKIWYRQVLNSRRAWRAPGHRLPRWGPKYAWQDYHNKWLRNEVGLHALASGYGERPEFNPPPPYTNARSFYLNEAFEIIWISDKSNINKVIGDNE